MGYDVEVLRPFLLLLIKLIGGWEVAAKEMGLPSVPALQNRVYERQGQLLSVRAGMQLQALAGEPLFARAVAQMSGGVFVPLPEVATDDEVLLEKFNRLYAKLGQLSATFQEATRDGEVDKREKQELTVIGQGIHETLGELLATTFAVFCREG